MNGVSLSKKEDQIYFTFPEMKQELSVSTAVGLLFLYEFYCMLRQEGMVIDSFFSVMMRDWSAYLAQFKPIYAVRRFLFSLPSRFPTFSRTPTSSVSKRSRRASTSPRAPSCFARCPAC